MPKDLKSIFCEVVEYVAKGENDGLKFSRDFFIPGGTDDQILRGHLDLLGRDPGYSDIFNALKSSLSELEAAVNAMPMEEVEALLRNDKDRSQELDVLEQQCLYQQNLLFAAYRQAYPSVA